VLLKKDIRLSKIDQAGMNKKLKVVLGQAKESEWHLNTPSGEHPLTPPSTRGQLPKTKDLPLRIPLVQMTIHPAKEKTTKKPIKTKASCHHDRRLVLLCQVKLTAEILPNQIPKTIAPPMGQSPLFVDS